MSFVDPDLIHRPSTGAIVPATWGDVVDDDLEWLYGDRSAIQVEGLGGSNTAGYARYGPLVFITGLLFSWPLATTIFTLDPRYRPARTVNAVVVTGSYTPGVLTIATSGTVTLTSGSTSNIWLNTSFALP